ncbi:MAG TPA: DUF4304 domain-containing protein [Gemmatimonadaceae bacterium]|nr:DUF4304 domain-containing protein [Gemmatimonadaceae bacterium]
MIAALRRVLVPELRRRGFVGSFPHFRRVRPTRIDLLTVQFSRWGGEFVVEIAHAPPTGVTMHWGEVVPPTKVTAHDVMPRRRLGTSPGQDDYWFKFAEAREPATFDQVAAQLLPFLESQAESYWRKDP